jgi:hypothetical protein
MGDYQFLAMGPQLSFKISNLKLTGPIKVSGKTLPRGTLKFTTTIKQENVNFPYSKYNITIKYRIYGSEGNEIHTFPAGYIMEDGNLSVPVIQQFYDSNFRRFENCTVKVIEYYWIPVETFESKES